MKLVSWNVNGIRAALKKDFLDSFKKFDADIFAIQETKCQDGQVEIYTPGYFQYFNSAERKGYSGCAVFTKVKPKSVINSIFDKPEETDREGRILALEFDKFWFVCVYTPNAQNELKRIKPRLKWGSQFTKFVSSLDKPVIMCGDFNVAHNEIDLKNPTQNRGNAGFSDEEREDFTKLLEAGFTDSFRYLYPDKHDAYSWWSYRANSRPRNVGWRIDYFLVSNSIKDKIGDSIINSDVYGSDHCPISLLIDLV
ncbi:MAG: exodeoxyribonuclease III [Coriobacteriia bacterium]|nr:exodeoxyribonuclease III [Coriobacteriia bacterium]